MVEVLAGQVGLVEVLAGQVELLAGRVELLEDLEQLDLAGEDLDQLDLAGEDLDVLAGQVVALTVSPRAKTQKKRKCRGKSF